MLKPLSEKPVTIRFSKPAWEKTRAYLFRDEKESACFIFAQVVPAPNRLIFLANYVLPLADDCYIRRTRTSAVVKARFKNKVYQRFAESSFTGFVNCHSQLPRGKRSCRNRTKIHCLSMVFGQQSLDARSFKPGLSPTLPPIEQVPVLGENLALITPSGAGNSSALSSWDLKTCDRQILAFGEDGQKVLSQLRVVLVGCGGIGSILAEGVCRLGIKNLTLVDHDLLSPHSLNRWQGGRPKDIGKPKAHVLARHLRTMFPGIKVSSIAKSLTHPKVLRAVKGADILIGAVDNHLARYLLNRISIQYLIPYLDAGTAITKGKDDKGNNAIKLLSRLAVVIPSVTGCMECSQIQYFDRRQLSLELYDPITRAQLRRAGYIKDHPEVEAPSVYPLNMLAALSVLIELKNLVTGFAPLARNVALDILAPNHMQVRSDSSNFAEGPAKDCINCTALLGVGDSEPLPHIHMPATTDSPTANNDFPLAANE